MLRAPGLPSRRRGRSGRTTEVPASSADQPEPGLGLRALAEPVGGGGVNDDLDVPAADERRPDPVARRRREPQLDLGPDAGGERLRGPLRVERLRAASSLARALQSRAKLHRRRLADALGDGGPAELLPLTCPEL